MDYEMMTFLGSTYVGRAYVPVRCVFIYAAVKNSRHVRSSSYLQATLLTSMLYFWLISRPSQTVKAWLEVGSTGSLSQTCLVVSASSLAISESRSIGPQGFNSMAPCRMPLGHPREQPAFAPHLAPLRCKLTGSPPCLREVPQNRKLSSWLPLQTNEKN